MSRLKNIERNLDSMWDLFNKVADEVYDLSKETLTHDTEFSAVVSEVEVSVDQLGDALAEVSTIVGDYEDAHKNENLRRRRK